MGETRDDGRDHPDWCSPGLCHTRFPDLHHRTVPDVLAPRGDGTTPPDPDRPQLSWALEQDDDIDRRGQQRRQPPVIALEVDGSRVVMSLDEAAVVGAQLLARVAEGRGRAFEHLNGLIAAEEARGLISGREGGPALEFLTQVLNRAG